MRPDLQVDDEIYKIRYGKQVSYYKLKIVNKFKSNGAYIYSYITKGKSKNKQGRLAGRPILAYRHLFFKTKIEVLHELDIYTEMKYTDDNYHILSPQVIFEIACSKKNNTEYWM